MTSTVRTNDPTKLPGIPKAPAGATAEEKRWYDTIAQIMEIRLGLRGDPRDRAITLRELISSGLALDLKAAPFNPNLINSTNIGFVDPKVPTLSVPPTPTGFAVAGAFSIVNLSWDFPLYQNHAHTEIWRHSADIIGDAQFIGIQVGRHFIDPVGSGQTNYYWIRHVNQDDVYGDFNSTSGTIGQTAPDVTHLLNTLSNAITESELATALTSKLDGFETDISDLETTFSSTASAATSAAAAAASESAAIAAKAAALLAQANAETAEDDAVIAKTGAETARSGAQTSATAASNSATGAAGSASSASNSATTAANSANAAGASATAAATSETNAATFATNAGTASTASQTSRLAAEAAETNAETAETNAATSATAAATSATSANASQTAASQSASTANTEKLAAQTARSGAETAETNAASSETNASGSASAASTSATNAANSATAAGNSASAANTSAQSAATEASAAGTSANAASASRTAASTSESNAANSASAASTSAQTAAASESAAGQSASTASSHANTASTKAGEASTFASQAASSESNAAGSASAASSTVNGLTARLDNAGGTGVTVEQQFSANASSLGTLEGQYTVKIDANGSVAGFGLANTTTAAGTNTTEFYVNADRFAILPDRATTADPAWASGVAYANGARVISSGTLYFARTAHTSSGSNAPPNASYWVSGTMVPFAVQATGFTAADGTYVPPGVYMNSAMIKHAAIEAAQIGSLNADVINAGFIDADRIDANTIDASKLNIDGSSITSVVVNNVPTLQLGDVNVNKLTGTSISATIMSGTTVYADNLTGDVNTIVPFRTTTSTAFRGPDNEVTLNEIDLPATTHQTNGHKVFAVCSGYLDGTAAKVYYIKMYIRSSPSGSYSLVGECRVKSNTDLFVPFTVTGVLNTPTTAVSRMKITVRRYGSNGTTPDSSTGYDYIRERQGAIMGVM